MTIHMMTSIHGLSDVETEEGLWKIAPDPESRKSHRRTDIKQWETRTDREHMYRDIFGHTSEDTQSKQTDGLANALDQTNERQEAYTRTSHVYASTKARL